MMEDLGSSLIGVIEITKEERDQILSYLDAYNGMVEQTIKQLSKKRNFRQQQVYDTCIKCSSNVKKLIEELKRKEIKI